MKFRIRSLLAFTTGVVFCIGILHPGDGGKAGWLSLDIAFAWAAGALGGIGIASFTGRSKVLGGCIGGGGIPAAYCLLIFLSLYPDERIVFPVFVFWGYGTIGGAALSAIVGIMAEGFSLIPRSAEDAVSKSPAKMEERQNASETTSPRI